MPTITKIGDVSDEAAIQFLCDIATLPFGGEAQEESCQWIGETLPTINEAGGPAAGGSLTAFTIYCMVCLRLAHWS